MTKTIGALGALAALQALLFTTSHIALAETIRDASGQQLAQAGPPGDMTPDQRRQLEQQKRGPERHEERHDFRGDQREEHREPRHDMRQGQGPGQDLQDKRQEYRKDLQEKRQEYRQDLRQGQDTGQSPLDKQRQEYRKDLQEKRQDYRQDLQEKRQDYRKDLQEKRQDYRQDLQDKRQEYRKELQEKRQDFQQDQHKTLQDLKQDQRDQRQDLKQDQHKTLQDLKQEQREQRQDLRQDMRTLPPEQRKELKDLKQEQREQRQDFQQDQRKTLQDLKQDQRDQRQDVRQNLQEKREEFRQDQRERWKDLKEGREEWRQKHQQIEEQIRREKELAKEERRQDRLQERLRIQEERLRSLREQRRERREEGGKVVVLEEPDKREIIREGNRVFIRHDDMERFRRRFRDIRVERRGGEFYNEYRRPDGIVVVTVTDDRGRLLRRFRRFQDGREVILIDNRPRFRGPTINYYNYNDYYVDLPPPRITIPRERYIVEAEEASEDDIEECLSAPPVEPLERAYTLDEIRYSVHLRERMRAVNLDTITFDFGSWELSPEQYDRLQEVADALNDLIQRNPDEVFLIEGHTDAVGSDEDNLTLSDRRAETVANVLSEQFKIPAENLVTQGYGEQFLKVQTDGPERANRRVVIRRITPLLNGGREGSPAGYSEDSRR